MKTFTILSVFLIFLVFGQVHSQEKTEKTNSSIEILLNSKNFKFIANTAIPLSGPTRNLVGSNYSITFTHEMVVSNMPFYGRAYSGMAYGRDKGMRFKGKPEDFNVVNTAKGFEASASVKGENDTYFISISVGNSGLPHSPLAATTGLLLVMRGKLYKFKSKDFYSTNSSKSTPYFL